MAFRFLRQLVSLFLDPRVSTFKKIIFPSFMILYWMAPDILPFMPIDDLLVTLLGTWMFLQSAKKEGENTIGDRGFKVKDKQGVIDVEGKPLDDEKG